MSEQSNRTGSSLISGVLWTLLVSGALGLWVGMCELIFGLPRALLKPGNQFDLLNIVNALANPVTHTFVRDNLLALSFSGIILTGIALLVLLPLKRRALSGGGHAIWPALVAGTSVLLVIEASYYLPYFLPASVKQPVINVPHATEVLFVAAVTGFLLFQRRHFRGRDHKDTASTLLSQMAWITGGSLLIGFAGIFKGVIGYPLTGAIALAIAAFCWVLFRLTRMALARITGFGRRAWGPALIISYAAILYVAYYQFWGHESVPKSRGKAEGPNLVMVVLDTVRADRLSVYGYHRGTTPFLESLAAEGARFSYAYTASPWTLPSHASFFTGLFPSDHGAVHGNWYLADGHQTIAESLRGKGYVTLGFSANPYISRYTNTDQGFDRMLHPRNVFLSGSSMAGEKLWRLFLFLLEPAAMVMDSGASQVNASCRKWLSELSERDQPFFLFLNYMEAHPPYPHAPETYRFFEDKERARRRLAELNLNWIAYNAGEVDVSPEDAELYRDWYDGCLYYLDRQVQDIYRVLASRGLLEDTILVVLSDHGESLFQRGQWGHAFGMYHEMLHVPLIIRYPEGIGPGLEIETFYSLKDLPPTLAGLMQGKKLEQMIADKKQERPAPMFAERYKPTRIMSLMESNFPEWDRGAWDRDQKSVLKYPYHLVWDSRGEDMLFRVDKDPQEENNIADRETEAYYRLDNVMSGFRARHPAPLVSERKKGRLDPDAIRRLRALGYMK